MSDSFVNIWQDYQRKISVDAPVSVETVDKILAQSVIDENDFLSLLSAPAAMERLEEMALSAHTLTVRHFGRVIFLYAPIYLANICDNDCPYCGFRSSLSLTRRVLSLDQLRQEAAAVAATGLRHVLLLTGDSRHRTPVSYLADCIHALKEFFASVSIEVYPLSAREYGELVDAGIDGVTMYQETYDAARYAALHRAGPKSDFFFRLEAPERAASAGVRTLSIGALLGLAPAAVDIFMTGFHARYLQSHFPSVELSVSWPRLQPCGSDFTVDYPVADAELVRGMCALRLFLPQVGMNISTREKASLRQHLIGLGVTRLSAGSRTQVGGYSDDDPTDGQFDVADQTSVVSVCDMIRRKGYQPVFKDWVKA